MKHVSRSFYWLKPTLWLLLLLGSYSLSAQKKTPAPQGLPANSTPALPGPAFNNGPSGGQDQPAVIAFRQQLKQYETSRQLGVAKFLTQHARFVREYTDAKGVYHFLHHIDGQGQPVYYQTRSNLGLATSINTNKLWQGGSLGLNLQGQGMEVSPARSRLGMWEPGAARVSHREFTSRAGDHPRYATF